MRRTKSKEPKGPGIPAKRSIGEDTLDLHLRANRIPFEREAAIVDGRKWRFDFLIPSHRIVVEVHGAIWKKGAHSTGSGLERDYEKLNAAVLAGYFPLQYSTAQVVRGDAIRDIVLAVKPLPAGEQKEQEGQ